MKVMNKLKIVFSIGAICLPLVGFTGEICIDTAAPNTGYCWPGSNGNQECSPGPANTCDGVYRPM